MRIVCISDCHQKLDKVVVPDGDVLIHAGDSTFRGDIREITKFARMLEALPHKVKICIAGNHDWLFQTNPSLAQSLLPEGVIYLQDSWCVVDGLVFYGSPWQPEFCNWAFNLPRGEALRKKWDLIPDKVDVLITHGPPFGIRDDVPGGERVGCGDLLKAVERVKPQLHVFGHIHNGYGMFCKDGITFVNASVCDERYMPLNAPIVIDL